MVFKILIALNKALEKMNHPFKIIANKINKINKIISVN